MRCYTQPLGLRLPHSPPPTRPLFTSFLKFSHLQLSPLYQTPPFVSLLHPPAAPNLHVIPELAAPTLRVRNPNPNPLRQGNGNPNPTSNPPGSVPMHTPLPPHPYRDALLLPSPPSLPATYDTTTAPQMPPTPWYHFPRYCYSHPSYACQPCS